MAIIMYPQLSHCQMQRKGWRSMGRMNHKGEQEVVLDGCMFELIEGEQLTN